MFTICAAAGEVSSPDEVFTGKSFCNSACGTHAAGKEEDAPQTVRCVTLWQQEKKAIGLGVHDATVGEYVLNAAGKEAGLLVFQYVTGLV